MTQATDPLAGDSKTPKNRAFASFINSLTSPNILLPNLMAALILGVLNIATALAIGTLIFSGPLAPYQTMGIGLFLISTLVGGVLVPAASGYKAIASGPRSGQAPIFAAMAASVVVVMGEAPAENMAVTVVVTLLIATVLIGVFLFVVGFAKIGAMVRYIPFPVMGGTFAGLGFLLIKGGILVALGRDAVRATTPGHVLSADLLIQLLPAAGFAMAVLVLERVIKYKHLIPVLIALSICSFYVVLFSLGETMQSAIAANWLPQPSQTGSFLPILTSDQIALVDWTAVASQTGAIVVLGLLCVIMLLIDVSGFEIQINRDLDPDYELKVAGVSNIIGGLIFSPLACQSNSGTTIAVQMGGTRFVMILFYGALVAGVIWIGPAPIAYMPPFVLGGFLMYIGIKALIRWVWNARHRLPLGDMLVVLSILCVVGGFGILQGVGVGIGLATVLFVHRYSQLSIIKTRMSGSEYMANIDRSIEDQACLDAHAKSLQLFILQGYLFFGSSTRLLEQIKTMLDGPNRGPLAYLLMDFRHVDAIDTSAANCFAKLMQWCKRDGLTLVLTGGSADMTERLTQLAHDLGVYGTTVQIFHDLEEGVGWCHDEILKQTAKDKDAPGQTSKDPGADAGFEHVLAELLGNAKAAARISPFFQRVELVKDQRLFTQGDPGDALYLILQGSISIVLDVPGKPALTVRTMRAGAILGEMALYTKEPRSASAVARQNCVLYRLDREGYETLQQTYPRAFGLFHSYVVRLMAERLGRANRAILALSR